MGPVSIQTVATDVLKYATVAVGILTVILNVAPEIHVPAGWQVVIGSVVTVLTAVISAVKQLETKKAVAAAQPNAAAAPKA